MTSQIVESPTEFTRSPTVSMQATGSSDIMSTQYEVHGHLRPRAHSPNGYDRLHTSEFELEWYDDDSQDAFEWVRLPKRRDWDILSFLKHSPAQRNTANTPLTARRYDGKEVVLWAKMDTGADVNTINGSTLSALFGETSSNWKQPLSESPELRGFTNLSLIGDQHFEPTHYVELSFHAGRSRKRFDLVPFVVVPDDAVRAAEDGVPNVILGMRTLYEHYMIVIDIEYLAEADPALEAIAGKAEEERPGGGHIGVIKYPTRPGVPPPRGNPGIKRRNTKITMTAEGPRVQSWEQ